MNALSFELQAGFIFLLGLVVGSFVNVLIYRLPLDQSVIRPGSHCPACKKSVAWYDNLPLLSYLILRGRCRSCQTKISILYPFVELITAFLFYFAFLKYGFSWLFFARDLPIIAALIAVTFIDFKHRIIPDELSIGGTLLCLALSYWDPGLGLLSSFIGAAFGFGLFYFFAWLYLRSAKRSGLGGGDIKFLALVGAFLGVEGVFATILVSSVTGSIGGILWGFLSRQENVLRVSIPFGPFLVLGCLCYYYFGEALWHLFTIPI